MALALMFLMIATSVLNKNDFNNLKPGIIPNLFRSLYYTKQHVEVILFDMESFFFVSFV